MAERTDRRIQFEDDYVEDVNEAARILAYNIQQMELVASLANSQDVVPGVNSGITSNIIGPPDLSAVSPQIPFSMQIPTNIKTAYISGGRVVIQTGMKRSDYNGARIQAVKHTNGAGLIPVSKDLFTFSHPEQNTFAPDFAAILPQLHARITAKLGVKKLNINSGFRTKPIQSKTSPHMAGIAVDFGATGQDRYTIADTAWEMGLRGVAIGQTFVHIDCAPDPISGWGYPGVPIYRGPSSH